MGSSRSSLSSVAIHFQSWLGVLLDFLVNSQGLKLIVDTLRSRNARSQTLLEIPHTKQILGELDHVTETKSEMCRNASKGDWAMLTESMLPSTDRGRKTLRARMLAQAQWCTGRAWLQRLKVHTRR